MIQAPVEYGQTLPAAMNAADARISAEAEVHQPSAARRKLGDQMNHTFLGIVAAVGGGFR